eukprot:5825664-Amphidinium_carterae.1
METQGSEFVHRKIRRCTIFGDCAMRSHGTLDRPSLEVPYKAVCISLRQFPWKAPPNRTCSWSGGRLLYLIQRFHAVDSNKMVIAQQIHHHHITAISSTIAIYMREMSMCFKFTSIHQASKLHLC